MPNDFINCNNEHLSFARAAKSVNKLVKAQRSSLQLFRGQPKCPLSLRLKVCAGYNLCSIQS